MFKNILNKLNSEVSGSTLGIFRILLGLVMIREFFHFHWFFRDSLSHSTFLAHYDGFMWLEMLPDPLIAPFFYLMIFAAILFTIGVYTRINTVLIFLGFSYTFLLDKGYYNNHFYFYCILLLLMCFVNASWGGLQNRDKPLKVPYWQVFILQLSVFVVYFYGGIAKIEGDWLRGVPLQFWMYTMTDGLPSGIREIYRTPEAAIVFSYIGLIFDLLVGFALFSRKYKRLALPFVLFFHGQNFFYFDIGTFPVAMISTTILFANPKYGEYIYQAAKDGLWSRISSFLKNKPLKKTWRWFRTKSPVMIPEDAHVKAYQFYDRIALTFMGLFFMFQFLFPLRHFLYKGNPSWTGEGHFFAWRMMLVDTTYGVRYWIEDEETGERFPVGINEYMTFRQFYKMSRTPKTFLLLAHFIRDEAKKNRGIEPVVKMEIYKSVNFRPPMLLNDTTLNYSKVEYHAIKPATWINDWKRTDQEIVFNQGVYETWKPIVEKQQQQNMIE